jgi:hypothetical protein
MHQTSHSFPHPSTALCRTDHRCRERDTGRLSMSCTPYTPYPCRRCCTTHRCTPIHCRWRTGGIQSCNPGRSSRQNRSPISRPSRKNYHRNHRSPTQASAWTSTVRTGRSSLCRRRCRIRAWTKHLRRAWHGKMSSPNAAHATVGCTRGAGATWLEPTHVRGAEATRAQSEASAKRALKMRRACYTWS